MRFAAAVVLANGVCGRETGTADRAELVEQQRQVGAGHDPSLPDGWFEERDRPGSRIDLDVRADRHRPLLHLVADHRS